MRKLLLLLVFVLAAVSTCCFYAGAEETAKNIASSCKIKASSGGSTLGKLTDGKLDTVFKPSKSGAQYIEIDLNGKTAQGLYLRWRKSNYNWLLSVDTGDGFKETKMGVNGFVQEYVELPEGAKKVRIATSDVKKYPLDLLDLEIYGSGVLPASVHKWNPAPSSAELMVICTYEYDEYIYYGGLIPYYTIERDMDTLNVFLAHDSGKRLNECLEALWSLGVRNHPIFLGYKDYRCETISQAKKIWDESAITNQLSKLIATRQPQVLVAQSDDEALVYSGQRILTSRMVKNAVKNAASEEWIRKYYADSQPYAVPKFYVHLYDMDQITMKWSKLKVSALGTDSLSAAKNAYKLYKSLAKINVRVKESGTCNSTKFGLYSSQVGKDAEKNDLFENITPRIVDSKAPASENFKKAEGFDKLYCVGEGDSIIYARYGTANGKKGWYAADRTGALLLPVHEASLEAADDSEPAPTQENDWEEFFSGTDMSATDDEAFEAYTDEETLEPHKAPGADDEGSSVTDAFSKLVTILIIIALAAVVLTMLGSLRKK